MARTRLLDPGFFKNETLSGLPYEARLCFAGLWCLADRKGRLEDRPRRIRAELFPYDLIDLEPILSQLAEAGFIVRYHAAGAGYIAIPTFLDHQTPHIRETESIIPAPPDHAELLDPTGGIYAIQMDGRVKIGRSGRLGIRADALLQLYPFSKLVWAYRGMTVEQSIEAEKKAHILFAEYRLQGEWFAANDQTLEKPDIGLLLGFALDQPEDDLGDALHDTSPAVSDPVSVSVPVPVSVSERDTPASAENADAAPRPTLPIEPAAASQPVAGRRGNRRTPKHLLTMPEEMAPVWALYPNKDGRQEAIQAWQQVRPAEDDRQRMLAHVDLKRKSVDWTKDEGRFCPRLSSYLRGRRWLDEGFQMPDGAAVEPVKFGPPASRAEIEQIATMKRAMLGRLPCTHEPACATDGDHDRALINGWRAPLGIGPLPFVVAPRRRGDA